LEECAARVWADIFARVSESERPPFRPPIPANDTTNDVQLIQLMRDCWDEYPTLRPDFPTIRNRFLASNKGKYDKRFTLCIPRAKPLPCAITNGSSHAFILFVNFITQ